MPHRADPIKLDLVAAMQAGLERVDLPPGYRLNVIDLGKDSNQLEVRASLHPPNGLRRHFVARLTEHWS